MSTFKLLPAGYTVVVKSWENDLNSPNTAQKTFSTEKDARTAKKLVDLLVQGKFGNEQPTDEFFEEVSNIEGIKQFINDFYGITEQEAQHMQNNPEYGSDIYYDSTMELLSEFGLIEAEYGYLRVLEDVKILYSEKDILVKEVV